MYDLRDAIADRVQFVFEDVGLDRFRFLARDAGVPLDTTLDSDLVSAAVARIQTPRVWGSELSIIGFQYVTGYGVCIIDPKTMKIMNEIPTDKSKQYVLLALENNHYRPIVHCDEGFETHRFKLDDIQVLIPQPTSRDDRQKPRSDDRPKKLVMPSFARNDDRPKKLVMPTFVTSRDDRPKKLVMPSFARDDRPKKLVMPSFARDDRPKKLVMPTFVSNDLKKPRIDPMLAPQGWSTEWEW
jgi:hypothetical protein